MKYFFSLVTKDLQGLMNKEDYNTPVMKKVMESMAKDEEIHKVLVSTPIFAYLSGSEFHPAEKPVKEKPVIDWDKIRAMQEGSEKDNAINIKGEPVDQEVKRRQRQFGILGEDEE